MERLHFGRLDERWFSGVFLLQEREQQQRAISKNLLQTENRSVLVCLIVHEQSYGYTHFVL